MQVLLLGHVGEDLGGGREVVLQAMGVFGVDAAVLLLERDGERQDFLVGELGELAHRGGSVESGAISLEGF